MQSAHQTKISFVVETVSQTTLKITASYGDLLNNAIYLPRQVVVVERKTQHILSTINHTQSTKIRLVSGEPRYVTLSKLQAEIEPVDHTTLKNILHEFDALQQHNSSVKRVVFGLDYANNLNTMVKDSIKQGIQNFTKTLTAAFILAKGIPYKKGTAQGFVLNYKNMMDRSKIKPNSVVIVHSLDQLKSKTIPKCKAIILEKYSPDLFGKLRTRHVLVPVIAGVNNASSIIPNNTFVTVDSNEGVIKSQRPIITKSLTKPKIVEKKQQHEDDLFKELKIYADMSEGKSSSSVTRYGVSLLDSIALMKTLGGMDNTKLHNNTFSANLIQYLIGQLKLTPDTPLLYQSSYIYAQEQHSLKLEQGAYEILRKPEFFLQEMTALKQLLIDHKFTSLGLVIPYVRKSTELFEIRRLLHKIGLSRSPKLKMYLAIHLPANLFVLENFLNEGIDGVVFDTMELLKTMYGISGSFMEAHLPLEKLLQEPTILKSIEYCVDICRKRNKLFILVLPENAPQDFIKKTIQLGVKNYSIRKSEKQEHKLHSTNKSKSVTTNYAYV